MVPTPRMSALADPLEDEGADSWARLMDAAQQGDHAAYRRLLKEILPVLRAIVRRKIFDPVLVEDVIQDTLLAVHRVRHTFDPRLPFLPWLSAIANARAIDAQRARGRQAGREVSDPAALDNYPDTSSTDPIRTASVVAEVRYRLDMLPIRQRQAVELVKLGDMSVNDAARASNQSVSTIKSLLHRAMANLRTHKDAHDE